MLVDPRRWRQTADDVWLRAREQGLARRILEGLDELAPGTPRRLIAAAAAGAHCRLLETTIDLDVSPETLSRRDDYERHLTLVEALGRG